MAVRTTRERRAMLEMFAEADGHRSLTPILRDAIELYIHTRITKGAEGVRKPSTREV